MALVGVGAQIGGLVVVAGVLCVEFMYQSVFLDDCICKHEP